MFIGEYHHTMDEKGRVAVPKKFQKELGTVAVITRGLDQCLFVFSKKEWIVLAGKLAQLPIAQAHSRAFSRFMLAGAMEVELDAQGRVMVPEYLRQYARLKKNVVAAGVYGRMELWDEEGWETYKRSTEAGSAESAEHLASLGV